MITFIYEAHDWVQHGARYRGGGDVFKKNAREARIVTIPDTSPTFEVGSVSPLRGSEPSFSEEALDMPCQWVPRMWPPVIVAIHGCCGCPPS